MDYSNTSIIEYIREHEHEYGLEHFSQYYKVRKRNFGSHPTLPYAQDWIDPISWEVEAPSYDAIRRAIANMPASNEERVKWFVGMKADYEIKDNNMLSHLTGVKPDLYDVYENPERKMNLNVSYVLCLFFELTEMSAVQLMKLGRHYMGTTLADIILVMFLNIYCYDIMKFVETVAFFYNERGLKLPSFYDINVNSKYKKYTSYSLSDCFDAERDEFIYDEVLESIRELTDSRRKAEIDYYND